jgi:hypothetical protein
MHTEHYKDCSHNSVNITQSYSSFAIKDQTPKATSTPYSIMFLPNTLTLAFLAATTAATPLPQAPTRVLRRELPSPSPYPLEETACKHEWKYLNFDIDNPTDVTHLKRLHGIICSGEMRALVSYGGGAAKTNTLSYKRFFPYEEGEDDYADVQTHVAAVLDLLYGIDSADGAIGSIVESFVVDNADFGDKYPDEANYVRCSDEGTLAYTAFDDNGNGSDSEGDAIESDGLEKIHFCDIAWSTRTFDEVTADCASLGAYPSEKMDTFSRIALHEMTHYSSVGPPIIREPEDDEGEMIKDVRMSDGGPAYGTVRAHALVDKNQDEFFNPFMAETNADNYAWMSLDALVSRHCATDTDGNNWEGFFTDNPPAI